MSVHEAITAHSRKQHAHLESFLALDRRREALIDEAVARCRSGAPFDADAINTVTKQINDLAHQGISPTRKPVTADMIREHAMR